MSRFPFIRRIFDHRRAQNKDMRLTPAENRYSTHVSASVTQKEWIRNKSSTSLIVPIRHSGE
jgi:hypothetical protein